MAVAGCGSYSKVEGFAFYLLPVLHWPSQPSSARTSVQENIKSEKKVLHSALSALLLRLNL